MRNGSETPYRYRAHGLTLHSAIALPELASQRTDRHPDVQVVLGTAPQALTDPVFYGSRAQASRGAFLLQMPHVARYHFIAPSRVVIEPCPNAASEDIRTFLLSSVMGALVHAQGLLPLHASAVRVGRRCLLVAGRSGAGKSTLAGELVRNGLDLVSDDLTAVCIREDGAPHVHPGYRALRLWEDTLQYLKGLPGQVRPGRPGHQRRTVLVHGIDSDGALPVRSVFLLRVRRDGPAAIRPLHGAAKITAILRQIYRPHLLSALGSRTRSYSACVALARYAAVYQVDRPAYQDTLADLAREIAVHEPVLAGGEVQR